ncbi:MAG: sulfatase-like hydrolase/transferase [Elusimicrobiaceae bacterium]|nr:sulfatase-like hydrolase/transferase [Elusimicrobiaceae bacterium]
MKAKHLFPFVCLQSLVWGLASLSFFHINGFYLDVAGILFTVTFLIGHTFVFALLVGLLAWPWSRLGSRSLQVAGVCWGSFFSTLLVIDWVVFSQYRFHVGVAMLQLLLGPARSDIFVFSAGMWLLAGLIILAILALETGLAYLSRYIVLSKRIIFAILGIWLVCFLTYNAMYAWGQFMQIPSIVSQRKALPLTFPLSANRQLRKWGFEPKRQPYAIPPKGNLRYPQSLSCPTIQKPLNVLLFLVDSWRADMLNPEVMPRLSAWVKKQNMTVFTRHLSGGNSTAGGVFSLFYSLPLSYWDDFTGLNLPPLLISQALQNGYEPAIFASSKLNSPSFDRNIFASIPHLRIGSKPGLSWKRDREAVEGFEHFLRTRKADVPFFGFIFLDAPHGYSYPEGDKPFTPAKEINYILLSNRTDPTPYFNQYKNSVYFIDKQIDQILSDLQQRHLLENTLVLITGDHGQELNDSHQNFWGHNSNFTDYQTNVPLVAHFPGISAPDRVDYRTTHYDIAPTVLQTVFQCSDPTSDYSIGYHLLDSTPRPFIIFAGYEEQALRMEDTILVFSRFNTSRQYGPHLEPVTVTPPATLVKEGLKTFSQFYK